MTVESTAPASVSCPLCHTVAPLASEEALAGGGAWRCPQCHQNWSATRLAAVAAYSDYATKRAAS